MNRGKGMAQAGAGRLPERRTKWGTGLRLAMWVAVFSAFYCLRDVAGIDFPDLLLTGICGLAFLFLDVGSALGMLVFTSTLTVPHNEIRIVCLAVIGLKLIRSGGLRLHAGVLLMTLGCMLLQLINVALFSRMGLFALIYDYVVRMLVFLLPLIWYSIDASPAHYRRAMLCYLWGAMLGGTMALILASRTDGFVNLLTGARFVRLGSLKSGEITGMRTAYNANQLGTMLAVAISILLSYMDRGYLRKLPSFAAIAYALLLIMMTKSRTGVLTALGAFVLYYWVAVIHRGRLRQGVAIFAAMLAVVLLVVLLIPEVVTAVVNRFVNQTDITNGRSDLLVLYLKEWISSPWCFVFGYGIGSYQNMVDPGIGLVPHNSITDILICWGLAGLMLVGGILWLMYRRSRRSIRRQDIVLAYLPAIVAIVASMAGQYTTAGGPHMRLCLLLLAARGFAEEKAAPLQRGPEVRR